MIKMKRKLLSLLMALIMLIGVMPATVLGASDAVPFTAEADGETINVELSEETYTHINWDYTTGPTVRLYVVSVPENTEEVTLDFGSEKVLVYGYAEDGTYIDAYDTYEDIKIGSSSAVVSAENFGYFAEVQTPYDDNWANELLYAIAFETEEKTEIPFTAEADGTEINVEISDENYIPVNWDGSEGDAVDLYMMEVPSDTETIILDFGDAEVLAYGYDSSHNYVTSYGTSADYWQTGDTAATISKEMFAEYVRIQTPYYDGYNSDLLYAIHIMKEASAPDIPEDGVSFDKLLENISESYTDVSTVWEVMEMGAYEVLVPSGTKLTDDAKQKYINSAVEKIISDETEDSDIAKEILALTAIGIDAEKLYLFDSEESVSAVEILNSVEKSVSAWKAPYVLAAYNQNDYENTENYEAALLDGLLDSQKEDGSWVEYESPAQTTATVIAGLSFYNDREDVKEAIEKGIDYLSSVQNDDGSFGNERNSNAAAMVVVGLCACGVNPDTDEDFIKNDISALDALLSYALEDNSGFGHTNNTVESAFSTEQAFRALIAVKQVMTTGKAFNIYDFSYNSSSLKPGYAEETEGDTPTVNPDINDGKITVTITIKAGSGYWMRDKEVDLSKKSTVCDALLKALAGTDIIQKGASDGYVKYMIKDGEKYGEFTEGKNSGWIYKVNNDKPDVGIKEFRLEDGDDILWYFTEDYTTDPVLKNGMSVAVANYIAALNAERIIEKIGEVTLDSLDKIKAARKVYDVLTEDQQAFVKKYHVLLAAEEKFAQLYAEQRKQMNPELEDVYSDITPELYYYEAAQWAVANEIASGVTDTQFGGETVCTRGQIVTFLWRLIGSPEAEEAVNIFEDVKEEDYYYDAVMWAKEYNITAGIEENIFGADLGVTRAQAITFLWRMAGKPEAEELTVFSDVAEDAYYCEAVMWAAENGITSGTFADMFSPDAPCLRGQILAFLYRCFGE